MKIDPEGFDRRVAALPGRPGPYRDLAAAKGALYYLAGQDAETALKKYDLEERKEETVLDGIDGYALSGDAKQILYKKGAEYGIVDAKPGQKVTEGRLKLDGLEAKIDPRAGEADVRGRVRILRDWFYDPDARVDWPKRRAR